MSSHYLDGGKQSLADIKVDPNWRQKGEAMGRGKWKFKNGKPCVNCGHAGLYELGGNGKAGSGERWCGYCLRQKEKKS